MDIDSSYEGHYTYSQTNALRKKNKIIVEKRRRERINLCLEEMKSLVLKSLHKDEREYSKMEKADILEMTVNYLQRLQNTNTAHAHESGVNATQRYQTGYRECAREVTQYLAASPAIDPEVQLRILNHLANRTSAASTTIPTTPQNTTQRSSATTTNSRAFTPLKIEIPNQHSGPHDNYMHMMHQMDFNLNHGTTGMPTFNTEALNNSINAYNNHLNNKVTAKRSFNNTPYARRHSLLRVVAEEKKCLRSNHVALPVVEHNDNDKAWRPW